MEDNDPRLMRWERLLLRSDDAEERWHLFMESSDSFRSEATDDDAAYAQMRAAVEYFEHAVSSYIWRYQSGVLPTQRVGRILRWLIDAIRHLSDDKTAGSHQ